MTISEKVAYLKGMADGLGIANEESKESRLISVIIEVLEEIGYSMEDLEKTTENLGEELDAVSDDLADVEEYLLDEDDDDDDDDDDEDDDDEDDDFFEIECPNCEETLVIDADVLAKGVIECPNCKEKFVLDLSNNCECGCGCGYEEEEAEEEEEEEDQED